MKLLLPGLHLLTPLRIHVVLGADCDPRHPRPTRLRRFGWNRSETAPHIEWKVSQQLEAPIRHLVLLLKTTGRQAAPHLVRLEINPKGRWCGAPRGEGCHLSSACRRPLHSNASCGVRAITELRQLQRLGVTHSLGVTDSIFILFPSDYVMQYRCHLGGAAHHSTPLHGAGRHVGEEHLPSHSFTSPKCLRAHTSIRLRSTMHVDVAIQRL